jgi:hypothetical protein
VEALAMRAWPYLAPVGLGIAVLWLLVPAAVRGGDAPTPLSPPVGALCDQPQVRLVWQASVGSGPYEVEVAESGDFSRATWRGTSRTPSIVLPVLPAGRTLHWRVRRDGLVGASSELRTAPERVPY